MMTARPFQRLCMCAAVLIALAAGGCVVPQQFAATGSTSSTSEPERIAHVVLVRGGVGGVFSEGLDQIERKLAARGVAASTIQHPFWSTALGDIAVTAGARRRVPIILIGHSIGALRVATMADALRRRGQRVDYLVTIAASGALEVPPGVRKATNYYFSKEGWGAFARPEPGFRGRLTNVDLSKRPGIGHFDADEDPRIQRQIVNNVVRIVRRAKRRR